VDTDNEAKVVDVLHRQTEAVILFDQLGRLLEQHVIAQRLEGHIDANDVVFLGMGHLELKGDAVEKRLQEKE